MTNMSDILNIHKINRKTVENMIYNSGDFFLPTPVKQILDKDIFGSSKKTFYFSGWSIIHFLSGVLFGYIYLYLGYTMTRSTYYYKLFILHTIWELWQMLIGMSKPYNLTGGSNIVDTLFDTLYFMIGAHITYMLYTTYSTTYSITAKANA